MDEASKLSKYIIVSCQRLPTGYLKLSLELPLVDQVVDSVSFEVDPTLPSKSEFQVFNLVSSVVDPVSARNCSQTTKEQANTIS